MPLVSWGQITPGYDFLYDGDIVVVGSDTTLEGNTDYILTFVDFDITLKYIPVSKSLLNGHPIIAYFQNMNRADTFFFKWENRVIDIDSTEILPFRLTHILHYPTPTPDINNFCETVKVGDFTVKKTGGDYLTIVQAIAGTSLNDTIEVYRGEYVEDWSFRNSLAISSDRYIRCVGIVTVKALGSASEVVRLDAGTTADLVIENMVIDAENTWTYGIYGLSEGTFIKCFVKNSTGVLANIATGTSYFENCIFTSNAGLGIQGQNYKITGSLIAGRLTSFMYNIGTTGTRISYYNKFTANYDMANIEWNRSNANYSSKFNTYNLNANITTAVINNHTGFTGTASYDYNIFNVNYAFTTGRIIYQPTGANLTGSYSNNVINYNQQGTGTIGFWFLDADNLDINNNYFESTAATTFSYILYQSSTGTTKSDINIIGNEIKCKNLSGYGIRIGEETSTVTDNTVTANISNNRITGGGRGSSSFHSVLYGFQVDPIIKYNYIDSCYFGIVMKHDTGNYYNEEIHNNIITNSVYGYHIKGVSNANIYNSTIDSCVYGFGIINNAGVGFATDQTIVNNIVTDCNQLIVLGAASSILESNYNIFYNGLLNGGSYATWQGLGYDANSFNTDPLLDANLSPYYTSDAYKKGTATAYDSLIYKTAVFPNPLKVIQTSPFTIGAVEATRPHNLIRTGSKVIIIGNKRVIYSY